MGETIFYYPANLQDRGKILFWSTNVFFFDLIFAVSALLLALTARRFFLLYIAFLVLFLTIDVGEMTIAGVIKVGSSFLFKGQTQTWKNKTQKSLQFSRIDNTGVLIAGQPIERQYAFWRLTPYNLSVLPDSSVAELVRQLTAVLSSVNGLELFITDAAEDVEDNLAFLQKRLESETVPQIRALLEKDMEALTEMSYSSATSRDFLAIYRLPQGQIETDAALRRIGKALDDAALGARRLPKDEVKKVLAAYFGVPYGNKIPDVDGAQLL